MISKHSPTDNLPVRMTLIGVLSRLTLLALLCNGATPPIVNRTTDEIYLDSEETSTEFGDEPSKLEFYRNEAYSCGLSGNYTFMIINPAGKDATDTAPLWVYLHGGSAGYYDEDGVYHTKAVQDENTFNHEESFEKLKWHVKVRITDKDGSFEDQTLVRRMKEGYRLLVVAYGDHDFYSGLGTPYPNNPEPNKEVNGLQANMAAIDFTLAKYPTTDVWVHGTSVGSCGVWALASSYALEDDNPLTGGIGDSCVVDPNVSPVQAHYVPLGLSQWMTTFKEEGMIEKVGAYTDPDMEIYPAAQIGQDDFRGTPVLFIAGGIDWAFQGDVPPIDEAVNAGFDSNIDFIFDPLIQAISAQSNSKHEVHILPRTSHVPTNDEGPANCVVDNFINKILENGAPVVDCKAKPATGGNGIIAILMRILDFILSLIGLS